MSDVGTDQRRGTRVSARLRVRVLGLDEGSLDEDRALRSGDISVSGVFFSTRAELGGVGAVERLELGSEDGTHRVVTPAVLVRVATVTDFWLGPRTIGAAFQFLPEDDTTRAGLAALVDHVAQLPEADDDTLPPPSAQASPRLETPAFRTRMAAPSVEEGEAGSSTLVVVAPWAVEPGSTFELSFARGKDARTLTGTVAMSRPLGRSGRYRLDLEVGNGPGAGPVPPGALEDAVASLLDAMDVTGKRLQQRTAGRTTDHVMAGSLARVPLASLLGFLEWEEYSGTLEVEQGEEQVVLHLRRGRLVDVEGPGATEPRPALRKLLGWSKGQFRLSDDDSPREDRVDTPLRALLMDLARESDEEKEH